MEIYICIILEAGKYKTKVPTSDEEYFPGLQMATFSLRYHMVERKRKSKLSGVPSYKGTNPIMRIHFYDRI